MDYESPLARQVASEIWSGLSRAALDAGRTKTTALWESLREETRPGRSELSRIQIFAIGQDLPDAIDAVGALADREHSVLYGLIVAVPDLPSPLSGPLLYQGVQRLTETGVRAGLVEPALLHSRQRECDAYARRLLERLPAV